MKRLLVTPFVVLALCAASAGLAASGGDKKADIARAMAVEQTKRACDQVNQNQRFFDVFIDLAKNRNADGAKRFLVERGAFPNLSVGFGTMSGTPKLGKLGCDVTPEAMTTAGGGEIGIHIVIHW